MQNGFNRSSRHAPAWVLCFGVSVLLHAGLALFLAHYTEPPAPKRPPNKPARLLTVVRAKDKDRVPQPQQKKDKPFAKTDADRPQQPPLQPDFEGQRNTRAEGMETATRQNTTPLPTQDGEEKPFFNHLQQERQDGAIEHYGKKEKAATPTAPTPPTPPQPQPPAPPQTGKPQAPPTPAPPQPPAQAAPQTRTPALNNKGAASTELTLQDPVDRPDNQQKSPAPAQSALGAAQQAGEFPTLPAPPQVKVYYDPTQADHAQPPGLRTAEHRTRSTGQFIIGKRPSLNVEATPRGQYEELVYRLIARQWYKACDEHRGDIIPGTIMIAIRINTRGQTTTMNLVNRRGAGVSQQSFTFAAIRRAQFPPMPPGVVATLVGDQMELIITFDFN